MYSKSKHCFEDFDTNLLSFLRRCVDVGVRTFDARAKSRPRIPDTKVACPPGDSRVVLIERIDFLVWVQHRYLQQISTVEQTTNLLFNNIITNSPLLIKVYIFVRK